MLYIESTNLHFYSFYRLSRSSSIKLERQKLYISQTAKTGRGGGYSPHQIFTEVDLLPIGNYSEMKKNSKKTQKNKNKTNKQTNKKKLVQIPQKLLVTLLLSTSCNAENLFLLILYLLYCIFLSFIITFSSFSITTFIKNLS